MHTTKASRIYSAFLALSILFLAACRATGTKTVEGWTITYSYDEDARILVFESIEGPPYSTFTWGALGNPDHDADLDVIDGGEVQLGDPIEVDPEAEVLTFAVVSEDGETIAVHTHELP